MSGRRTLRLPPHRASRLSAILLFGIAAVIATWLPAAAAPQPPLDGGSTLFDPGAAAVTATHDVPDVVPAECPTAKAGWVLHSPPRTVPGPTGTYLVRDWSSQAESSFAEAVGSAGDPDRGPPSARAR